MADQGDADALRRLTTRLDEAAERAERLLSESIRAVGAAPPGPGPEPPGPEPEPPPGPGPEPLGAEPEPPGPGPERPGPEPPGAERPPPSGYQQPGGEPHDRWLQSDQLQLLLGLLAGLRDRIPPVLRERLLAAFRELLIALRAVIDWYLEHSDTDTDGAREVRDIPIR